MIPICMKVDLVVVLLLFHDALIWDHHVRTLFMLAAG